jgi:hypothetical protein
LNVSDQPVVPFIEGDGTGADIRQSCVEVVDAAVAKAYGGQKIHWMEVFAGEIHQSCTVPDAWLPEEALRTRFVTTWCPSKARSRSVAVSAAERRTTPGLDLTFVCVPSNILTAPSP